MKTKTPGQIKAINNLGWLILLMSILIGLKLMSMQKNYTELHRKVNEIFLIVRNINERL